MGSLKYHVGFPMVNRDHSSKLLSFSENLFLCTHTDDSQTDRQTNEQTDGQC